MKWFMLAVISLAFVGCDTHQQKVKKTTSQVESLAEKWEQGDDSILNKHYYDAWGNKIVFKVDSRVHSDYIDVKSNGPDGLPFTSDDIVAKRERKKKDVNQVIEDASKAIGKGLASGVKEGVTNEPRASKKSD